MESSFVRCSEPVTSSPFGSSLNLRFPCIARRWLDVGEVYAGRRDNKCLVDRCSEFRHARVLKVYGKQRACLHGGREVEGGPRPIKGA